ncbi:MAG: hypothetical protein A2486_06480 [Burkholderiales bacterium RIFOXYC12_FULL_65_23]|nr:MAG: hypothetical protein A2486_06480 [Burkholderiales bacterium RIFOXYC12_FULL_65_23]
MVAYGLVFIDLLPAAALNLLQLRCWLVFDRVTQHRAADDAQHGGSGSPPSVADGIPDGSASNGAHQGTRPGLGFLYRHGFGATHLAGNHNLANDGR